MSRLLIVTALVLLSANAFAVPGLDAMTVNQTPDGGQTYTLSIQILLFMTALSLLPGALMMTTSFARILIVLAILRQALGTQNTPSNQILVGLTLFLTVFIMMPVFTEVNQVALQPYLEDAIGAEQALEAASDPVRGFMLAQTREDDLALFARIADFGEIEAPGTCPFRCCCRRLPPANSRRGFRWASCCSSRFWS